MSIAASNFWNFLMPVAVVMDTISPNCDFSQDMIKGKLYYIFNKNYPSNYTAGTVCRWVAKSPPASRIFLSCDDITMPRSSNCIQDHLEISSSDKKNLSESHKYCGEGAFSLITQGNILTVVLRTTKRSNGGRFLCSITAIDVEQSNAFQKPPTQPSCQCGWKNDKKIVGGQDTLVNEYPAMAALINTRRKVEPFCGGTIISNRFVLTAAHCIQGVDPSGLFVLVGDHNLDTGSDTSSSAIYKVIAYEMFDGYDPETYAGDIGLVQVDKINFNENVGPICLPFRYTYNSFEGENITALGWGFLEFSGAPSEILQKVELQVIPNDECEKSSESAILGTQLCTYTPGKDTCQGDSGGPVLWQNTENKRLFLLGIISSGIGCGGGVPGVNTRVSSFLEWIQRRTGDFFCSA